MSGVIYFAEQVGGRLVKIGWTKGCPKRRVQSLQTGSPMKLRLLGTIAAESVDDEKRLHTKFADLRVHGEWFRRSEQILALLPKPQPPPDRKLARIQSYVIDRFRVFILDGHSSVDEIARKSGIASADLREAASASCFENDAHWLALNSALDELGARYPMRRERDRSTKAMLRRRAGAA